MLAICDAPGIALSGEKVKSTRAVHLRGHGFYGFEGASTMVLDTYGETVDDLVLIAAGGSVSGIIEDDAN